MGKGEGGFFTADEVSYAALCPTVALPNPAKLAPILQLRHLVKPDQGKSHRSSNFQNFPGIISSDPPR